ncbi:hypothetical protein Glove_21g67 [Diversispora epigaea]|uniref:Uncharacterized protein n=1 Tax=Diversispora epigaea TaxID=1348612 RepID=A0A397JJW1_9GLOM|nr:hypothetical protein Glove_21g67 [Diversispora epigaea]
MRMCKECNQEYEEYNEKINAQLNAEWVEKVMEWIPYHNDNSLENIEFLLFRIYGITKDPETDKYIMPDGNLRSFKKPF